MPDTCVPTVTEVTGSMVPVAVMLLCSVRGVTASCVKLMSCFCSLPDNSQTAAVTMAKMPAPIHTLLIFKFFIVCDYVVCSLTFVVLS